MPQKFYRNLFNSKLIKTFKGVKNSSFFKSVLILKNLVYGTINSKLYKNYILSLLFILTKILNTKDVYVFIFTDNVGVKEKENIQLLSLFSQGLQFSKYNFWRSQQLVNKPFKQNQQLNNGDIPFHRRLNSPLLILNFDTNKTSLSKFLLDMGYSLRKNTAVALPIYLIDFISTTFAFKKESDMYVCLPIVESGKSGMLNFFQNFILFILFKNSTIFIKRFLLINYLIGKFYFKRAYKVNLKTIHRSNELQKYFSIYRNLYYKYSFFLIKSYYKNSLVYSLLLLFRIYMESFKVLNLKYMLFKKYYFITQNGSK